MSKLRGLREAQENIHEALWDDGSPPPFGILFQIAWGILWRVVFFVVAASVAFVAFIQFIGLPASIYQFAMKYQFISLLLGMLINFSFWFFALYIGVRGVINKTFSGFRLNFLMPETH
ncbi:MAG: hypothetical protein EA357_03825 [Micavibrio sp.]|nr:MAG: hypothetical protein EA357_03825 [Micavibrio sp.]